MRSRILTPVTNLRANGNSCVHAGVVVGQTSIVPGRIFPNSAGERMTHASTVTRPGLTVAPLSLFASTGTVADCGCRAHAGRAGMCVGGTRNRLAARKARRAATRSFKPAHGRHAATPPGAAFRQRFDRDGGAHGSRQFVGAEMEYVVGLLQRACFRERSPKFMGEGTQHRPTVVVEIRIDGARPR